MIMHYAKKPTLMIPTPAGCCHLSIKLVRTIINFIIYCHKQIFLLGGSDYFVWDRPFSNPKYIANADKKKISPKINILTNILEWKNKIMKKYTYVCQHFLIISAIAGSISSGMSRRRCWKPTAPTTCIGFIPPHGCCIVESSHNMTPKL